jgi:hypothetical protein
MTPDSYTARFIAEHSGAECLLMAARLRAKASRYATREIREFYLQRAVWLEAAAALA